MNVSFNPVHLLFVFRDAPGGLPGRWGGAALSGATLLEYPGKVRRCTGSRGGHR